MQEEDQLIKACQRNDRRAQCQLYQRFRTPMYRMCLRYARDAQEAEDFLHDGMLKVFQDISNYRGQGALGGWIRRVILNVLLQQIRKRPTLVSVEFIPEGTEVQAEQALNEELNQLSSSEVFQLVRQLPIGYRTVFNLYYLEQLSHKEIATELSISVGSSKSQLHKGRVALRKAIEKKYPHYQYRSR